MTFANIDTLVAAWDAIAQVTSRHLVILVNAQAAAAVGSRDVSVEVNGDGGNNYNRERINGAGAGKSAARDDGVAPGVAFPILIPGTTVDADAFGGGFMLLPHAFNSVGHKVAFSHMGAAENEIQDVVWRWANTAAITDLVLAPAAGNFAAGSIFVLCVVDERFNIGEQILSGADGTFTFAGISQRDGDLVAIGYLRSAVADSTDNTIHEINGDGVAANYFRQFLLAQNAATIAATGNNDTIAFILADNATANAFSPLLASYSQYAKGINDPHYLSLSGTHDGVAPRGNVAYISGRRNNVEGITSLKHSGSGGADFKDGSMMSLYFTPIRRELLRRRIFNVDKLEAEWDDLDQFTDDFDMLTMLLYGRTNLAAVADDADIELNDDAVAANYDRQLLQGAGAVVTAIRSAGTQELLFLPAATEGAGEFGGGSVIFPAYALTDRHKHFLTLHGRQENIVALSSHRWEDTDPIIKIEITPATGSNFVAGSVFELWGLVPLDQVIRREQDKLAAGRDALIQPQMLRPGGRAWRH